MEFNKNVNLLKRVISCSVSTEAMRLIFSMQLRCMARKPVFMVPKEKVGSILVSVCP